MGRIKRSKIEINSDIETQTKICCVCNIRKPFVDFYNFKNQSDGKSYRCKSCDDASRHNYRKNNSKTVRLLERNRTLKFKYGITLEDYYVMLESQKGCCAICGGTDKFSCSQSEVSFSVDHCHKTGKIRGLLCNACNRALGFFRDSEDILDKARKYLINNR